ncbi:MAG: flagellin FliC [Proteobacteria bacterium]|nr:flagellin FliC [Pseudomonadota bacterium]
MGPVCGDGDRKMSVGINTNISSVSAVRAFEQNRVDEEKASLSLASGSRINQAADDAAGLSVAAQLSARNHSSQVALRNTQDAISLIQLAEGAMSNISELVTRFRELAVQAASDTVGANGRSMLNREVFQLGYEIDRIAKTTDFNGTRLLDGGGSWPVLEIQTGVGDQNQHRLEVDRRQFNVTLEHLGLYKINLSTKELANEFLPEIDAAISEISKKRANIGALAHQLDSLASSGQYSKDNHEIARSRVIDADVAHETAKRSKAQIMAEFATAVVSQANSSPKVALRLLTG